MILQSKATGGITFKDGSKIKILKAGGTLVVESEEVAKKLMKMYSGIIVEVDTGNSKTASTDEEEAEAEGESLIENDAEAAKAAKTKTTKGGKKNVSASNNK